MRNLFIIILGLSSLVSAWVILSIIILSEPDPGNLSSSQNDVEQPNQNSLVTGKQVITTWSDAEVSATPILQHSDTVVLTPGEFYSNSADSNRYEIYYDEPSGNITILLTAIPLSFSRQLAEAQLKQIFSFSEAELCRLEIRVAVNSAVSEQYARTGNLGLSFCAGSTSISD